VLGFRALQVSEAFFAQARALLKAERSSVPTVAHDPQRRENLIDQDMVGAVGCERIALGRLACGREHGSAAIRRQLAGAEVVYFEKTLRGCPPTGLADQGARASTSCPV